MSTISEEVQDTLWKIGDALAQGLSDLGDPSWRVTGLGSKAWKITHPDLPVVKDDQGVQKDVLLQMHLQEDEDSDRWFVIAQNKVVSPDSHSSPRLFIVADQGDPPHDGWPIEDIAQSASKFFNNQKELLVQEAQAASPQVPYNSGPPEGGAGGPPGLGGPLGGPLASRRKKIAQRIAESKEEEIESGEYAFEPDEYDETGRANERDAPEVLGEDYVTNWLSHSPEAHSVHLMDMEAEKHQDGSYSDQLPGGEADDASPEDYDEDELELGIKEELEHTDDRDIAEEIAMDHLEEDSDYYSSEERKAHIARRIRDLLTGPEDEGDIDPSFGWDPRSGIGDKFIGG